MVLVYVDMTRPVAASPTVTVQECGAVWLQKSLQGRRPEQPPWLWLPTRCNVTYFSHGEKEGNKFVNEKKKRHL